MGSDARSVGEGGGGCGDCILQTCYQTTESWHEHLSDTFCRVRILVRIMTTRNLFRVPHSRFPGSRRQGFCIACVQAQGFGESLSRGESWQTKVIPKRSSDLQSCGIEAGERTRVEQAANCNERLRPAHIGWILRTQPAKARRPTNVTNWRERWRPCKLPRHNAAR